jgi:hypothetical protein
MAMNPEERRRHLDKYRECMELAIAHRRDLSVDESWVKYIEMYSNRKDLRLKACDGDIYTNLAFATVDAILSSTLNHHPSVTVNPQNAESEYQAKVMERALNTAWRTYDWTEEIHEAVQDSLVLGIGICKVGYRQRVVRPRGTNPDPSFEAVSKEANKVMLTGAEMGRVTPDTERSRKYFEQLGGEIVVEDHPTLARISPFSFYIDPMATRMKRARWVAQVANVPLDVARRHTGFNSSVRSSLSADNTVRSSGWSSPLDVTTGSTIGGQECNSLVMIVEFYDLETGKVCKFHMSQGGDFLQSPVDIPFSFGHPFIPLMNHKVPESLYSMGEIELVQPLIYEYNAARRIMNDELQAWRYKLGVSEGSLSESAKKALESEVNGAIVEFPPESMAQISQQIHLIQPPPSNPGAPAAISLAKTDLYQTSGVADYQRGGGALASTATEASIIADAASARSAQKIAKVESFMSEIAAREAALMAQFMAVPRQLRMAGVKDPETQRYGSFFFEYDRRDLQGSFDFDVVAGSSRPLNEEGRRQRAQQLAAVVAQYLPLGLVDERKWLAYLLEDGFGLSAPERLFKGDGPPSPGIQDAPQPPSDLGGVESTPGSGLLQTAAGGGQPATMANQDFIQQPPQ